MTEAAATEVSVYDRFAPLYRAAGFRVVPIAPGTKYPGIHQGFGSYIALVGWPNSNVTDTQPRAGIGLICGDPLIAADIDSDDEALGVELIDAFVAADSGVTITKAGRRGQTLLLRPPLGVVVKSRKFLIDGKTVFEMLAEGRQTVLPPTIHPDLNAPYRWGNGATPLNTGLSAMAMLREDWEARVEEVLSRHGYQPEPPAEEKSYDDSSPFQQINTLALQNLREWVPALDLYRCRPIGRRYPAYEAVATWRPSTTGRPPEARNLNLSIKSKGIKDFGAGKGYSPLDLVMAQRSCSLDEAFSWLTGKLGPQPNTAERVVDFPPVKETPGEEEKQPEPPKIRFKLVPFGDMRPGLEPLYLVDELIPVAGLVDIWGKPKCFKSFWTLDVSFHVSKGWEYRDRAVQQGTVVYCAFEGAHGYKKRIEAIRRFHGLLDDEHVPLYIMPGQANLIADHKTLIADISAQLKDKDPPPVLVVLDTLNKSLMGSASKDTDMSAYVRAAEAIRDAFKCVVVIVHHCGLDDTRPRGHTSLPGAVDAQLAVVREGNAVTVTVEMMRDDPEETVVTSVVEPIPVGCDSAGKELTSLVVKPGETPVPPGHGWTKPLTLFRRALSEALNTSSLSHQIPGGALVRAANIEAVRAEFYKTYVAKADTPIRQQAARRQAFHRSVEKAQLAHLIGVYATDAQTLVWLAANDAYAQPAAMRNADTEE
jgi:hypothetical protein